MHNRTYDIFRGIVTLGLPASATLYFSLSEIWGLPATDQVVGTIAVLTTFLGVIVRVLSRSYYNSDRPYDGALVATHQDGGTQYSLELGVDPQKIIDMKSVNFKVAEAPQVVGSITDESIAGH